MNTLDYRKIYNIYFECYRDGWFQRMKDLRYRKRHKKMPYYHDEIYLRKFCNRLYLNNYFHDDIEKLSLMFWETYNDKENKKRNFIDLATKYIILFCSGFGVVFFWSFFSDSIPYDKRPEFLNIVADVFLGFIFIVMLKYMFIDLKQNNTEKFLYRLKDVEIMMAKDKEINQMKHN